ncbi:MAG: L,D-transpeptidase family protein [Nitrospinae bacterium]|nr:L,D-transpeptidase family protein [Nitrospinota bacterium]
MLKNVLRRLVYVLKIRVSVAYSNFKINRTFGRYPSLDKLPMVGAVVISFLIALSLVAVVSHFDVRRQPHKVGPIAFVGSKTIVESGRDVISQGTPPRSLESMLTQPNGVVSDNYVLAVDKSRKMLFVLREIGDSYHVVRNYDISLGRKIGDKQTEGDLKTPSGLYQIIEIKSGRELPDIYGPKAFVTNYPNSFDVASGRGGGGIWLHGSKTGKRNPDSHGCVVLDNQNLLRLDEWVHKSTPIAIFPEDFSLPVKDGKVDKKYISVDFFYGNQLRETGPVTQNNGVSTRHSARG